MDRWVLKHHASSVSLNLGALRERLTEDLFEDVRRVFLNLVQTINPHSAYTAHVTLLSLVRHANGKRGETVAQIDSQDVSSWVMDGNSSRVNLLKIYSNRAKILKSKSFSSCAYSLVASIKVDGASHYESVRTWDPKTGPYRPSEDFALKTALDGAFNDGNVSLRDYVIARLFRGLGIRPTQVALLKVGDVLETGGSASIRIPKVKDRGSGSRESFMPPKPITRELLDVLQLHITVNVEPRLASGFPISDAPVFPAARAHVINSTDLEVHINVRKVSQVLSDVFAMLSVKSPITGEIIHVNPRRERHTFLTQLAMNGCGALEIAANAGHASPQSCEAYVDASIDHYQRMERLVGEAFIPMADRFLGNVTNSEDDISEQHSHIYSEDMNEVGSCASGGCDAIDAGVAPFACYSCRKFNAWADAPHEDLLNMLIEEQALLNEQGHGAVAETKTQTIVAITDLLEAIRQRGNSND